jgi:hypothetical protein
MVFLVILNYVLDSPTPDTVFRAPEIKRRQRRDDAI